MVRIDRLCHDADRVRIGRLRGEQRLDDLMRARIARQPAQDREHFAEDVAFVAGERPVHEAQIKPAREPAAPRVVPQQPCAPVLRQIVAKRMKQMVEVMVRVVPARQIERRLHAVPQRVRVQHETRARHDVGPVVRLVLLQQEETLVLLRSEPLQRALDVGLPALACDGSAAAQVIDRDQPPQRRVDAAQIPEARVAVFGIDVLRDLPVRRLRPRQRIEARDRPFLERRHATARHREHAHAGVAPEDSRVTALVRHGAAPRGEDALRRQFGFE